MMNTKSNKLNLKQLLLALTMVCGLGATNATTSIDAFKQTIDFATVEKISFDKATINTLSDDIKANKDTLKHKYTNDAEKGFSDTLNNAVGDANKRTAEANLKKFRDDKKALETEIKNEEDNLTKINEIKEFTDADDSILGQIQHFIRSPWDWYKGDTPANFKAKKNGKGDDATYTLENKDDRKVPTVKAASAAVVDVAVPAGIVYGIYTAVSDKKADAQEELQIATATTIA